MIYMFFILALAAFGYGLYIMAEFLRWRLRSHITRGEIIGFSQHTSYGLALPVLSFETQDGRLVTATAARIDRLLYIMNRPGAGSFVSVAYAHDNPEDVRVSGYLSALISVVLMLPVVAAAGLMIGQAILASKVVFLLLFIGIMLGCWIVMKVIQRS